MRLLSIINIRIRNGYLPHLTNEIYKRGCEIRRSALLEDTGTYDIFQFEIFYSNKEKFKGLLDKITKHEDNFQIISFENDHEEEITGGLLDVTGKIPIESQIDYEMKVLGLSDLALDFINNNEDNIKYTGISKNIGLVSGFKDDNDSKNGLLKSYVLKERDSIIINKFAGLNAFPFIIKFSDVYDFIKTLQRIESTFSALRICDIEEVDDTSVYEQLYSESSLPITTQSYDELPLYILTVINYLIEKYELKMDSMNIGFIGLNISTLRLTNLILKVGFYRVLGCDKNVKFMHAFEKEGGLATSEENIFKNSDIIILFKNDFNKNEFNNIGSGQTLISLIDEELDTADLKDKGVKEIIHNRYMDLSILFPGILKGLIGTGLKRLEDDMLINLSKKILATKPLDNILPNVFSNVHDTIIEFIQELS